MPDYETVVDDPAAAVPAVRAAKAEAAAYVDRLREAYDRGYDLAEGPGAAARRRAGEADAEPGSGEPSPPETPLMSLGAVLFTPSLRGLSEVRRMAEWRYPVIARVGLAPARQSLGPGTETISMSGVIHPHWRGGVADVQTLRDAGREPARLLDGAGRDLGLWAVLRVEETWTRQLHGRPRRIAFTAELGRVGDAAPSGALVTEAQDAAAEGDTAAAVAAVDAAAAESGDLAPAAAEAAIRAAAESAIDGGAGGRRVLAAVLAALGGGPDALVAAARRAAWRSSVAAPLGRLVASVAYRAREGDTLGAIAHAAYGAESAVADIIAANPAAARSAALAAGELIGLPPATPPPPTPIVRLWT